MNTWSLIKYAIILYLKRRILRPFNLSENEELFKKKKKKGFWSQIKILN